MKQRIQFSLLVLPWVLALGGCGSDSPGAVANSAASKPALNSAPSGSDQSGIITPTPTPTPTPSATPSPTQAGSRPFFPYSPLQGYGPTDGQAGNPMRMLYLGTHTALGIDQRLRVRMNFMSSPGRFDSNTGQYIAGQSNYNTIAATLTMYVNGAAVDSKEVCAGQNCGTTASNIADFSTAVYQATYGRPTTDLSLRISNVKSDNKYITGFCNSDYNTCYNGLVYTYGSQYAYSFCANAYNRCMANSYPYAPLTQYQGWRFGLDVETDITIRF